jgi:hypothetical protein
MLTVLFNALLALLIIPKVLVSADAWLKDTLRSVSICDNKGIASV